MFNQGSIFPFFTYQSFFFRSGSLGSAKPILDIDSGLPLAARSCGDMTTSDPEGQEDARKLVQELRQKTRAQAQQIMAWRRAYKMQVGKSSSTAVLKRRSKFFDIFQYNEVTRKYLSCCAVIYWNLYPFQRQSLNLGRLFQRRLTRGLTLLLGD